MTGRKHWQKPSAEAQDLAARVEGAMAEAEAATRRADTALAAAGLHPMRDLAEAAMATASREIERIGGAIDAEVGRAMAQIKAARRTDRAGGDAE